VGSFVSKANFVAQYFCTVQNLTSVTSKKRRKVSRCKFGINLLKRKRIEEKGNNNNNNKVPSLSKR